ncbi:MAG: hypothetical protein AAF500_01120 [Myxococcota bacterium]
MRCNLRWVACGILFALLAGCGDSSVDDGTGGSGGSVSSADAFMFVNRVRDPSSRTNFVSVLSSLAAQEIELTNALEVPGFSRFRTYDESVFTFNGESQQVTRYAVTDDLTLREEGRFSMVNLGVQGFRTSIVFISPERAYYIDPVGFQVVVWNPATMEITTTFPIPELERDGFPFITIGVPLVVGDYVATPVSWRLDDQSNVIPATGLLVVSAVTDEFTTIAEDMRCGVSASGFVFEGAYYALGDWDAGVYSVYNPGPTPSPCLVRWNAGDLNFDPDYVLDMAAFTGSPQLAGVFGGAGDSIVARVYDTEVDVDTIQETIDPDEYFNLELWRWAQIDFRTQEVSRLGELDLTGISFNPSVVDGVYYVPQIDEETQTSVLFAVDGTSVTQSVRATGDIITVGRIR